MKPLIKSTGRISILLLVLLCDLLSNAQPNTTYIIDNTTTATYDFVKTVQIASNQTGVILSDAGNAHIYFRVYTGTVKTVDVDITSYITWPHPNRRSTEFNAFVATNGNVFITYNANDSYMLNTTAMRYFVLNSSGTYVTSGQVNTTNPGASQTKNSKMVNLSNGKVLILFGRSDNGSYAFRIFNNDGTAFTGADNVFETAASLGGSPFTTLVAANNNGVFFITTYYANGNLKGFLFNNDGTSISVGGSPIFNIDPTVTGEYSNQKALALPNGNFLAYWSLRPTGTSFAYYKIIDPAGADVVPKTLSPLSGYIADVFPDNTSTSTGFYIAEYIPHDPTDALDSLTKVVLRKYGPTGTLISTTDLEGFINLPTYYFLPGPAGEYSYAYSVYKNIVVDESNPDYPYIYGDDLDLYGRTQIAILPLNYLSFTAKKAGNQSMLYWQTAFEENTRDFTIQYSIDATNWKTAGSVKAARNSQATSSYQFTHKEPAKGRNYYRLIETDMDGKQNYSSVVSLVFDKIVGITLAPNPAMGYVMLGLPEHSGSTILIFNNLGRIVYKSTELTDIIKLNLEKFSKGVYNVHVIQNGKTYSKKLIIQ